jgi:ApbE superfamily uncharacterized protein (UPF0280 family)
MADKVKTDIVELRHELHQYARMDSQFLNALTPYIESLSAFEENHIINKMFRFAKTANVGPMASVAGIFAQEIGERLQETYSIKEMIIENGGDLYLSMIHPLTLSVYAGNSMLSEKVGLKIHATLSPLGVCTSSGTVGHSLSFGNADAAVIMCKETGLADAYATSYCNEIKAPEDVEPVIKEIGDNDHILGALIICKDRMGIIGQCELVSLNP